MKSNICINVEFLVGTSIEQAVTEAIQKAVYSKCSGTNCSKRDSCFRYTVESLPKYQPWLVESVSIPEPEKCKWFINSEEKTE